MGVKGKKDYLVGITFQSKRILSILQMIAYNQELQQLGIRLENIFQWFLKNISDVNLVLSAFLIPLRLREQRLWKSANF